MREYEKMVSGMLYNANEAELVKFHEQSYKWMDVFNKTEYGDFKKREELVRKIFKNVGSNCIINKPLHIDYGINISVGDNFYANFDCCFLDVANITIGNNVFIGPKVSLFTATHPIDPDGRNSMLEYGKPIIIGNNVWIGGGVIVNPGVIIGDNVVIGSGSVVTKDISSNSLAYGNPCKVIREITSDDRKQFEEKLNDYNLLKHQ